jgi:hypothetical protein
MAVLPQPENLHSTTVWLQRRCLDELQSWWLGEWGKKEKRKKYIFYNILIKCTEK